MNGLPPVSPDVLVEAVDGLPARLRKKLDDAMARAVDWTIAPTDSGCVVVIDDATTVTLTTDGGVVRVAGAACCTCLLAPNCLHRAVVLARAPIGAGTVPGDPTDPGPADASSGAGIGSGAGVGSAVPATPDDSTVALSPPQMAAIEHLWRAAVAVIEAGVAGSGVVARTVLLRAAHDAQATGVHRAAAAARSVATLLQAARANEPQYRLADLTDALRELLGVVHRLRHAGIVPGLLGSARRRYEVQGSLRLYGLCTTAVLADSGYAGVLTYVVDRDRTMWTVADIAPGDAKRAAGAGNATVALGETALSHRALTRAGLVVSGATGSASRQLGAGTSVRAVTGSGAGWHEDPSASLWTQPLPAQVHRAFDALALPVTDRPAGQDLLFLTVRVTGTDGDAVHAVTDDGVALTLRVASDHPALAYRDNLRLLGQRPGLEMLMIGRPDPNRQATVFPLAVAPAADASVRTWSLPATLDGHVDLAFDRLHRSHLPPPSDEHASPAGARSAPDASSATDPALYLLRRTLERVVGGGRAVLTFASSGRHPSDGRQLSRARLDTGAALLDRMTSAAVTRPRDAFGRLSGDDGTAFARAWLAAAVYADAADRAFAEASWLPGDPGLTAVRGGAAA